MYAFVALWNAKPGWLAMSREQRAAFIDQVTATMDVLVADGFEVLFWTENDAGTDRRAGYDYAALWKMADQAMVQRFERALAATGWYRYFDQVNVRGTWSEPEDVLRKIMLL